MILQISRNSLPTDSMKAILSIEKTLSTFEPDEQLAIAGECVFGVLRGLRIMDKNEPQAKERYDSLCGQVQSWFRSQIETLRFTKSN